jgi:antitoxin YefM
VLDDVRDTHDRVVITRNGRPEAGLISVSDLETIDESLDLPSTPGAVDEIRTAEAEIARGEAIGADALRRLMAERIRNERDAGWATRHTPCRWRPPPAASSPRHRHADCR